MGKSKLVKRNHWILTLQTIFFCALCFCLNPFSSVAAEDEVVAAITGEDALYLYIKGIEGIDNVTVQIGSTFCNEIKIMDMEELSTPMRTAILIDNSRSVRKKKDNIQNILEQLLDQSLPGEEYRFGIFSDEVNWLSDYTSDYDSIKSDISSIEYENQVTYFNDCLYYAIEEMLEKEDAVYSRIIMISDGANDQSIGYTNYEMGTLVEESNIPVYMIGTPGDNTALETMFSFARASEGAYFILDDSVADETVVETLLVDHDLKCIQVFPAYELMDGSKKNIQIIFQNGEIEKKITAEVQMPFAKGDQIETENTMTAPFEEEETENTFKETENSFKEIGLPTTSETEDAGARESDESNGRKDIKGVVVPALVMIVVVICFSVFLVVRLKKKKNHEALLSNLGGVGSVDAKKDDGVALRNVVEDDEATVLCSDEDDGTICMEQVMLLLRDISRPEKEFKFYIRDAVKIGKLYGDIVIDYDKYISREQCEIVRRGEFFFIRDLNSSNGTFYENQRVFPEQEIQVSDGGQIRIGNSKFILRIIRQ